MTQTRTTTVTVRLFALYRERLGRNQLRLALPAEATVATALAELARQHPQLVPLVQHTMVAVNQEYAGPEQPLRDGDEVALIPPVSGGQGGPALPGPPSPSTGEGEGVPLCTASPFPLDGALLQKSYSQASLGTEP
jgi:molybdopterin converting factor subunit 1